jgi:hypothetical protein
MDALTADLPQPLVQRNPPSSAALTAERLIQPVHRVVSHAFHEAQVGIHRLRNGGLAEQKLYEQRVSVAMSRIA